MKVLALVLLLFVASPFYGCASIKSLPVAYTYSSPEGGVTFYSAPCTNNAVLGSVGPEFHNLMQAASGTYRGKSYEACWIDAGNLVLIAWEDGDKGKLSKEVLQGGKAV